MKNMKRFISAVVFVLMLCVPALCAQITFDNLYAIYDNDNGFVQLFPHGDEIKAVFSINKMKAEGYGEIEGNEAVLFLDNDEEVTMTFGNFRNGLAETIIISGYRPFNGTYNAYHGHM